LIVPIDISFLALQPCLARRTNNAVADAKTLDTAGPADRRPRMFLPRRVPCEPPPAGA
jgi:hypothetical protein